MTKEAMEYLADLKLHAVELEEENQRLIHQQKRLDEEIKIIEDAIRARTSRPQAFPKIVPPLAMHSNLRLELIETYCNDVPADL